MNQTVSQDSLADTMPAVESDDETDKTLAFEAGELEGPELADTEDSGLAADVLAVCNILRFAVDEAGGSAETATVNEHVLRQVRCLLALFNHRRNMGRTAEKLVLNPVLDAVGKALLPLWRLASKLGHTEALQLLTLVFVKLSHIPIDDWDRRPPEQEQLDALLAQDDGSRLARLKQVCIDAGLLRGLETVNEQTRAELKLNGHSAEDFATREVVMATVDRLQNEDAPTAFSLPAEIHELLADEAAEADDENFFAEAPRVLAALRLRLEALEEKRLRRKLFVSRSAMAVRVLLLNLLRIADPASLQGDTRVHGLLCYELFQSRLANLLESEWRLLVQHQAYERRNRLAERTDEFGLLLGSDHVVVWRCLEFYFNLLRQLRAVDCGRRAADGFLERDLCVPRTNFAGTGTGAFEALAAVPRRGSLNRSGRFNAAVQHTRIHKIPWDAAGDRRRHRQVTSLSAQGAEATWLFGSDITTQQEEAGAKKTDGGDATVESLMASEQFQAHVGAFISTAFPKLAPAWITDCTIGELERGLTTVTRCRLLGLVFWGLAYCRGFVEHIIEREGQIVEELKPALERQVITMVMASRSGIDPKTLAFVVGTIRSQMKVPAKERSQAVVRSALRLLAEELRWAEFLLNASRRQALRQIGRAVLEHLMRKGVVTLLQNVLKLLTSFRVTRDIQVLALASFLAIVRLVEDNQILARGRGIHLPKNTSMFQLLAGDHTILNKMLTLDNVKLDDYTQGLVDRTLNLVDPSSFTGSLFGWHLSRARTYSRLLKRWAESRRLQARPGGPHALPSDPQAKLCATWIASVRQLADAFRQKKTVLMDLFFTEWLSTRGSSADLVTASGERRRERQKTLWSDHELSMLISVYDRNRHQGPTALLRDARRTLGRKHADDIAIRLVSSNLLDVRDALVGRAGDSTSASQRLEAVMLASWAAVETAVIRLRAVEPDAVAEAQLADGLRSAWANMADVELRDWLLHTAETEDQTLALGRDLLALIREMEPWKAMATIERTGWVSLVLRALMCHSRLTHEDAKKHTTNCRWKEGLKAALCAIDHCVKRRHLQLIPTLSHQNAAAESVAESVTPVPIVPTHVCCSVVGTVAWRWLLALLSFQMHGDAAELATDAPLLNLETRARWIKGMSRMPLDQLRSLAAAKSTAAAEQAAPYGNAESAVLKMEWVRHVTRVLCRIARLPMGLELIKEPAGAFLARLQHWAAHDPAGPLMLWGGDEEEEEPVMDNEATDGCTADAPAAEDLWAVGADDFAAGRLPQQQPRDRDGGLSLLALRHSLQFQALLYLLGGEPDHVVNPQCWTWFPKQLNTTLLTKQVVLLRFLLTLSVGALEYLRKHGSRFADERAVWSFCGEAASGTVSFDMACGFGAETAAPGIRADDVLFRPQHRSPGSNGSAFLLETAPGIKELARDVRRRLERPVGLQLGDTECEPEAGQEAPSTFNESRSPHSPAFSSRPEKAVTRDVLHTTTGGMPLHEAAVAETEDLVWEASDGFDDDTVFAGALIGL